MVWASAIQAGHLLSFFQLYSQSSPPPERMAAPYFLCKSFSWADFFSIQSKRSCFSPPYYAPAPLRFCLRAQSEAFSETKPCKVALQKGVLVEFQKETGKTIVGVTQSPEGKKNWNVIDQNANKYIVRPNQIKLAVPGAENFSPEDVDHLLREAESLQDPSLLEVAWEEVMSMNRLVDVEQMASILYGSTTIDKCYSAYRLIVSNPAYFKCKGDGYFPIYEARPLAQVKELLLQQMQEAIARKAVSDFAEYAKSVMQGSHGKKPTRALWCENGEFSDFLEALEAYSLDMCKSSEQRSLALQVMEELGIPRTPYAAVNALTQMGYFGVHENLHLLKVDIRKEFPNEVLAEADAVIANPPYDLDKDNRVDLTFLKVYTIDCDDAHEIDDGLSAIQMCDGHLKVWIHVADPTRWVGWDTQLQREASRRCTSVYLPTRTIPMFPERLSTGLMSLQQGKHCPSVSVSVLLSPDGSVAESTIENSTILPSYALSYDSASELLSMGLEEELELSLLHQAALQRNRWRRTQGAVDLATPDTRVHVIGEDTIDPEIRVWADDQTKDAYLIVSEMMILCGEVIASFGGELSLCFPYRGQASFDEQVKAEVEAIPSGPARVVALLRCLNRSDMNFVKPVEHACLGLRGYAQFTSPLRRYGDLLCHYQIKSILRGEEARISVRILESSMALVSHSVRIVKKLQSDSERYWILEYLRQQPAERRYKVCLVRFDKDGSAIVLFLEMGFQSSIDLQCKKRLGDEFFVCVIDSQPRKNLLILKEALS